MNSRSNAAWGCDPGLIGIDLYGLRAHVLASTVPRAGLSGMPNETHCTVS